MATWSEVQVGDWVRGKDGALWGVVDRRGMGVANARFTMRRNGKPDFQVDARLSQPSPEVVRTGQEIEESAISAAASVLGASVMHVEQDGMHFCPPEYAEPGALMAHLHILHGSQISDGEATLSALETLHTAKHKTGGHTPHHHTPDYLARNRG